MLPLGLVEIAGVVKVLKLLLLVLGDDIFTAHKSYFRIAVGEEGRFQTTTKVEPRTLVTRR